jgi:hypothetical protein
MNMFLGRSRFNERTQCWEFADGSGAAVPVELQYRMEDAVDLGEPGALVLLMAWQIEMERLNKGPAERSG